MIVQRTKQLREYSETLRNLFDNIGEGIHVDHILELQSIVKILKLKNIELSPNEIGELKAFVNNIVNLQLLHQAKNIAKKSVTEQILRVGVGDLEGKHFEEIAKQLKHIKKLMNTEEYKALPQNVKRVFDELVGFFKGKEKQDLLSIISSICGCSDWKSILRYVSILLFIARIVFFLIGCFFFILMRIKKKRIVSTKFKRKVSISFAMISTVAFVCFNAPCAMLVAFIEYILLGWYYRSILLALSFFLVVFDCCGIVLFLIPVIAGITGGITLSIPTSSGSFVLAIISIVFFVSQVLGVVFSTINVLLLPLTLCIESLYIARRMMEVEENGKPELREDVFCCCMTKMSVCWGMDFVSSMIECIWSCCCCCCWSKSQSTESDYQSEDERYDRLDDDNNDNVSINNDFAY